MGLFMGGIDGEGFWEGLSERLESIKVLKQ